MKKANLAFSVKMIELMLDYFEKQVEVLKELDVLLEDSKHSRLTKIHPLLLVSVHTFAKWGQIFNLDILKEIAVTWGFTILRLVK